jgi:hypothetical protein
MKHAPLHHSLLLTVLIATAAPASAQEQVDPRWTPWLGCWTVSVDTTRGGDAVFADQQAPQARVCVTARGNAASLVTELADKPPLAQSIVADGSQQPLSEGGCRGSQKVQWSSDGARLYSRAELTCAAGARRTVSGISLLAPDGTWIDAQSVDLGGHSSVRVRRFRPEQLAGRAARFVPERLTIENVIDASPHVAAPALEAALVESRATFGLNARRLLQMDAAGVPSTVIDVMVALTYPQAFSVRPTSRADSLTPFPFGMDPSDPDYPWWYGNLYGPGVYFDSAYLFSPFGYEYLPYYPPYFGGGGIIVGGGGGGGSRPTPGARVVDGLGYTRTVPRNAETASNGETVGSARGSSGSRATASSQGFSRGGSDSSSSGSSSSGGSSGGGSGDSGGAGGGGGRTAVPR